MYLCTTIVDRIAVNYVDSDEGKIELLDPEMRYVWFSKEQIASVVEDIRGAQYRYPIDSIQIRISLCDNVPDRILRDIIPSRQIHQKPVENSRISNLLDCYEVVPGNDRCDQLQLGVVSAIVRKDADVPGREP